MSIIRNRFLIGRILYAIYSASFNLLNGKLFSILLPLKFSDCPLGALNISVFRLSRDLQKNSSSDPCAGLHSKDFGAIGLVMVNKSNELFLQLIIFQIFVRYLLLLQLHCADYKALYGAYITVVPNNYFSLRIGQSPSFKLYGNLEFYSHEY
jgi:hypothetical protein